MSKPDRKSFSLNKLKVLSEAQLCNSTAQHSEKMLYIALNP